jgi:hypothetical protein
MPLRRLALYLGRRERQRLLTVGSAIQSITLVTAENSRIPQIFGIEVEILQGRAREE